MIRACHSVLFGVLLGLSGLVFSGQLPSDWALAEPNGGLEQPQSASGLCGLGWSVPVDAEIVDWFRAPEHLYGPGNRGLEYRTSYGQQVVAVADGRVVFAGPVGGRWFVVVIHDDGIRSTYVGVHDVQVGIDDEVVAGSLLALADEGFHLTARLGETYLDPEPLLAASCFIVRLVPLPIATSA